MTAHKGKLLYVPIANFGDALNPWIWQQLTTGLDMSGGFDVEQSSISLSSIGSFLTQSLIDAHTGSKHLIIAGTGVGYGFYEHRFTLGRTFPHRYKATKSPQSLVATPSNVTIAWLRGPLTANALGFSSFPRLGDAAYLIRKIIEEKEPAGKAVEVAFMPHIGSACIVQWEEACNKLGWVYLNPESGRENILSQLRRSRLLITEALHGAIAADALRVPWIPVSSTGVVLRHKWEDFCGSVKLPYAPILVRPRFDPLEVANLQRHPLKKSTYYMRAVLENRRNTLRDMVNSLETAAKTKQYLSTDSAVSRIDECLDEGLDIVRSKISFNDCSN